MNETLCFLDANVVASSVTRTLVLVGARQDGILTTWSAHVEAEADRHCRPGAMPPSQVRQVHLHRELSASAADTCGLRTPSLADRRVLADAITAAATFLITVDVDDFDADDLREHCMSAVNPDYFMALRFSLSAYRAGVAILATGTTNPPRSKADVHRALGRRHPHLSARFAGAYDSTPVAPDKDQPSVIFRGAICVRCNAMLITAQQRHKGVCAIHLLKGMLIS